MIYDLEPKQYMLRRGRRLPVPGLRDEDQGGNYSDCADADIIVNAIGMPRKPGQTRLEMLDDSIVMLKDVIENPRPMNFQGIIVSITNPADIVANYLRAHLELPRERCFYTGTSLDTARLKRTVSELADIDRRSVTTCSVIRQNIERAETI